MESTDILVELYREEWCQRRQYRELRAKITATLLALACAIAAVVTLDQRVGKADVYPGLLITLTGCFGFGFSLIKHQRYRLHVHRSRALLGAIDERVPGLKLSEMLEIAGKQTTLENPNHERWRLDLVYCGLHLCIALTGVLIVVVALGAQS